MTATTTRPEDVVAAGCGAGLGGHVTACGPAATTPARNARRCPYCRAPIGGGLLAVCPKPDCRVQDAADTARIERRCDDE